MTDKAIFMTGVTGTLGKEILKTLVRQTGPKIYVLVRRKNRFSHWDRIRRILSEVELTVALGTRVHVAQGDITLPELGLAAHDRKTLIHEVTDFYHIAALTTLNASEEDCREINIEGTEKALQLAWEMFRQGKLKRFFYFSTAYVAGSLQQYHSPEDALPQNPAHANFYEASKYQSETRVRQAMAEGLPVTIVRPSIVVGHSKTGEVSEFNVIYPFIRLFAHGVIRKLPTRPENAFNIVPIDFVVDAFMAIARRSDTLGSTYHLVSDPPPSIGMLLQLKEQEFKDFPSVDVICPGDFQRELLSGEEQFIYDMMEPYLGYLNGGLTFDTQNARRVLDQEGIDMPKATPEFLKALVDYAIGAGYLIAR